MKLKIEVDDNKLLTAVKVAKEFSSAYPDRVGIYDCCVYADDTETHFIAYRTKTGTVCVKQSKEEGNHD